MSLGVVSCRTQLVDLWSVLGAGLEEAPLTDDWTISPYGLLPAGPNYSHYMGSLTTPPCTEVSEIDMKSPRKQEKKEDTDQEHKRGLGSATLSGIWAFC